jgi:general secretion pathway protein G
MKRRARTRVFFPWERRAGVLGLLGRAHWRVIGGVSLAVLVVVGLRSHEARGASIRATRARITTMHRAVWSYRADHAGACPKDLTELVTGGYARAAFVDAWGRPLRLTCPSRRDPQGFDIMSDGPDGIEGGLDRVQ